MNINLPDKSSLTIYEVCDRIEKLTTSMMNFWKTAHGWAPVDAAGLLNQSMLEWQSSLAASLCKWLDSNTDGDLILAWANLGALVEGQLKLFLSVYYNTYLIDAHAIKDRKGKIKCPDESSLEYLRQFFKKRIWTIENNWNSYIEHIQERRNAIHAFKTRNIGTFCEWKEDVRTHLAFIRYMNSRLPYPDMEYEPREI
jgi:hypothetical protein